MNQARERARKIVANPNAYNRDNLVLAQGFLELDDKFLRLQQLAQVIAADPAFADLNKLRELLRGE